ncbi:carotenoid oxygenase family protein [Sorangium sp. So ce341]|uniref:carotenoid oxygenase family protein n=1 Tax=Sorangium sp. So ce341 TaxID=3133302 RepID=UPI003F5FA036
MLFPSPRAASAARPAAPAWLNGFRNLRREHGFELLRTEGTLPDALSGTLFRNGPGLFDRFGERYAHWFDGDGAVTGVRFADGRARGACRVVQTVGLQLERRAGRRLFGGWNTPPARPFRELLLGDGKNPVNTHALLYQGRLFATCEGGLPVELSPDDLGTLGEADLDGVLVHAFSAHAHRVPARRASYNFGARLGPKTELTVYELPDEGRPRRLATFAVEGARVLHDFIATERHLVFVLAPIYLQLWKMLLLRRGPMDASTWRAGRGTEIVIVPIDRPSDPIRMKVDAFLCEHTANAFERDGTLVFDFIHYPTLDALERFVGGVAGGAVRGPLGGSLRRGILDPARRTLRLEERLPLPVDMPRVSPQVDARPHRYIYLTGYSAPSHDGMSPWDAVAKLDVERGSLERYVPGPDQFPSEAVFVPRSGAGAEDDGYLLTLVYDARADLSYVAVLDARSPSGGPLARAFFDHPVPFGFHGAWMPAGRPG